MDRSQLLDETAKQNSFQLPAQVSDPARIAQQRRASTHC
jgi:hypothetical protein